MPKGKKLLIKKEKEYTLDQLIPKCSKYIHAIYKLPQKNNKIIWRITSDKIQPHQHFDSNENQLFSGETLLDAMMRFFNFLKRTKRI